MSNIVQLPLREAGEPPDPGRCPAQPPADVGSAAWEAWDAKYKRWVTAYQARLRWLKKQAAKERKAERDAAPHPNWKTRLATCHVQVPVPADGYRGDVRKPRAVEHRSPWERWVRNCGQRAVAWDVTDRRAVGYMYGACVQHLQQAMADDPSRVWWWANTMPVDPDTVEEELVLLILGGR